MINIVFDMDGILFDTERLSMESWRQAALQMELGDIEEGIYGCIGLNRTDCRILMKRLYGEAFPYEQFIACNSALFQERVEREGLPVKKGASRLLAWLKERGAKIALASSTRVASVKSHLDRAGFAPYFQVVVGGDMVEHSKPCPDIYLLACSMLNVDPCRTIAVEDSPNGIRSAHAAGMLPVMIPDMVEPTPELEVLLYKKFNDLLELKEFLENEE